MTKSFYVKSNLDVKKSFAIAHAVINHIGNIEKAIDNKVFVWGVFVDLQKVLDTVNHKMLLHRLYHYRIGDLANCCFSSYLSNRKQFVTKNLQYGVPRGSLMGPLLFNIFQWSS